MAKKDVREGDVLTIKVKVTRVSDDGEQVTIDAWGQRVTGPMHRLEFEKQERGPNWPE